MARSTRNPIAEPRSEFVSVQLSQHEGTVADRPGGPAPEPYHAPRDGRAAGLQPRAYSALGALTVAGCLVMLPSAAYVPSRPVAPGMGAAPSIRNPPSLA
jgi:hypothetical protein